jgi:hypothetical protein
MPRRTRRRDEEDKANQFPSGAQRSDDDGSQSLREMATIAGSPITDVTLIRMASGIDKPKIPGMKPLHEIKPEPVKTNP